MLPAASIEEAPALPTDVDGDDSSGQPQEGARISAADHSPPRHSDGPRLTSVTATGAGAESAGRILSFARPRDRSSLVDPLAARSVMARLANLTVRITADNQEHSLLLRRLLARAEGMRVIDGDARARRQTGGRRAIAADATLLATDLEPRALLALVGACVRQVGAGAVLVTTEQTDPALDVAAIAAGAADLLEVEELDTERLQRAIRLAVARSLLQPPGR